MTFKEIAVKLNMTEREVHILFYGAITKLKKNKRFYKFINDSLS